MTSLDIGYPERGSVVASFRGTKPLPVALGALAGIAMALLVGPFVVRAVASIDEPSGWEDLVAIAVAVVAFVPVGALIGGLSGSRFDGLGFWRGLGPSRPWVIAGAALSSLVVGWIVWVVWDPMSGTAAAAWALPIGGLLGFVVHRRRSLSPVGF